MRPVPSDAELHAQRHRRRRWIVRISLVSLLAIVLLIVAAFAMTSSNLSIEEAKSRVAGLNGDLTREEVEKVFGKPFAVKAQPKLTLIAWCFFEHSIDKTDSYSVILALHGEDRVGRVDGFKQSYMGKDAWIFRWLILRWRLGFPPK
jgi:hypothetical protein